jgi:hypothetical protein
MLNYHIEWEAKTFPTGRKGKDEWMILNQARKEITKFLNNSKFENMHARIGPHLRFNNIHKAESKQLHGTRMPSVLLFSICLI